MKKKSLIYPTESCNSISQEWMRRIEKEQDRVSEEYLRASREESRLAKQSQPIPLNSNTKP